MLFAGLSKPSLEYVWDGSTVSIIPLESPPPPSLHNRYYVINPPMFDNNCSV